MRTYINKTIRFASCILAFTIVLGAGLNSCDNSTNPISEKAKYEVVSEQVVAKGYSGAQGLTSNKNSLGKKLAKNTSTESKVFCTEPIVYNTASNVFKIKPAIYSFSESGAPKKIFEFQDEDAGEFYTWGTYPSGEGAKMDGLKIDAVLTQGDSVFYTINVSDKIFLINNETKEIYLQSPELVGTSGLIQGKDGKLYLAQVPKPARDTKRIISVDKDKSINTEVEIPMGELRGKFYGSIETAQHLSIAEADSGEFFITDFLGDAIYKYTKESGLEDFITNAKYFPQSIDASSKEDLLILTAPLSKPVEELDGSDLYKIQIERAPKIIVVNKNTKEANEIHSFSDAIFSYWTYTPDLEITIDGQRYLLPDKHGSLSSTLQETSDTEWEYSMSKPVKGEVVSINIVVQDTTSGGE